MKWIESTIGDVCDVGGGEVKTGPFGSQLHQSDYSTIGTPVVMPKDIIEGDISDLSVARVGPDHVERLSKHKLNEGDIVYGRRGDIGRQALITKKTEGWLCGTGCLRVTIGKPAPVIPSFLHLYLRQNDVISWIANQAVGATMPNLNTSILRSVPVRFPESKTHQKELADVICTYDALIENNNRRITILEEIAQSLYREWFVKFRFPGNEQCQMVDSPLGLIPEGWDVKRLDDLVVLQRGFDLPKKKRNANGNMPIFAASGINGYHDEYKAKAPGLVTGRSGTLGVVNLVLEDFWPLNTSLWVKEFKACGPYYAYFLLSGLDLARFNSGASVPTLNRNDVHGHQVLLPPVALLEKFEGNAASLFKLSDKLTRKNENLKKQRDLLLPKLISGQIDLSQAEQASA